MSKITIPEKSKYYTYVYLDPRKSGNFIYQRGIDEVYCFNNELIYTGKGSNDRINKHIKDALNTNKNKTFLNVIRKIYEAGLEPIRFKILQNVTEEEAFAEEINIISIAGRRDKGTGPLCNETDGGEGCSGIRTDLTGKKFGRLTVIRFKNMYKNKSNWFCKCECGNCCTVLGDDLKRLKTKSCGCLREENITTHNKSKSLEYKIWEAIKHRCNNSNNNQYKNYGGRGITVCDRWSKFENFYEDMGDRPTDKHILSRKDKNGNFEPDNCKWLNELSSTVNNETKSLKEWSKISGTNYQTIQTRLQRGWTDREAIFGKN